MTHVTASAAGLAAGWLLPNRLLELAFGGYSAVAALIAQRMIGAKAFGEKP